MVLNSLYSHTYIYREDKRWVYRFVDLNTIWIFNLIIIKSNCEFNGWLAKSIYMCMVRYVCGEWKIEI